MKLSVLQRLGVAAGPMLNIYLTILGVVILSLGCLLLGLRLAAQAGQED